MRKNNKFRWYEDCEKDFQTVKMSLTTAPVITLPAEGVKFKVYSDASKDGLGFVLMQQRKVISHDSRQFKIHERNYRTHDFQLVAIVFTLII